MKKTQKTAATTARSERFVITLTALQARRLRFVSEELGMTAEALVADAAVDQVGAVLEDGLGMRGKEHDAERDLAQSLNSRRPAA
jgi:hypothetical protein